MFQIVGIFEVTIHEMNRNRSISLGSHLDDFIQNRLSSGRYNYVCEIDCAKLKLLEEEENRTQLLKISVHEGLDSGLIVDFNPEQHLAKLKTNFNVKTSVE